MSATPQPLPRRLVLLNGTALLSLSLALLACGGAQRGVDAEGWTLGAPGARTYDGGGEAAPPPRAPEEEEAPAILVQPGELDPMGPVPHERSAREAVVARALAGRNVGEGRAVEPTVQRALEQELDRRAGSLVPVSELFVAELEPGQGAVARFTLEPGACYAFVGVASDRAARVEVNVISGPPKTPQLLLQVPAESALGQAGERCSTQNSLVRLPVLLDLRLASGSGLVAARVYRR